jgi:hypothetical protein
MMNDFTADCSFRELAVIRSNAKTSQVVASMWGIAMLVLSIVIAIWSTP